MKRLPKLLLTFLEFPGLRSAQSLRCVRGRCCMEESTFPMKLYDIMIAQHFSAFLNHMTWTQHYKIEGIYAPLEIEISIFQRIK